jgi:hypothetical protein
MGEQVNVKAPNGTAAEWVKFVSSVLVIPTFAFGLWWMIRMDRDIASEKASRFTASDGLMMQQQYASQVSLIWTELAQIRVELARQPPEEFAAYTRALEARIRALEIQIATSRGRD